MARTDQATQLRRPDLDAGAGTAPRLLAVGSILGALAASSCCILPLVLFSLGISGAWIGSLTALAPYQPVFMALALACLWMGLWRVYRAPAGTCADGTACARPISAQSVKGALWLAAVMIAVAVAFDFVAPRVLAY
ncbi:MAG: mercury transporter MerT [Proteobacteria bacterium]|nr:mercury transporter MerT [Pseudomonadota bacterium]